MPALVEQYTSLNAEDKCIYTRLGRLATVVAWNGLYRPFGPTLAETRLLIRRENLVRLSRELAASSDDSVDMVDHHDLLCIASEPRAHAWLSVARHMYLAQT